MICSDISACKGNQQRHILLQTQIHTNKSLRTCEQKFGKILSGKRIGSSFSQSNYKTRLIKCMVKQ